jgi:asparagine synthase (glutamine-hydrolysing)
MLHATPEAIGENQPLVDKRRGIVLTADARIDNRSDLIGRFGWTHRPGSPITDAELILEAYARWGQQCPEQLVGAFAFALWDEREQRLFCARDHVGIKPLYYYRSGRVFVVASEVKALLHVDGVPARINELRVADYLAHVGDDADATFYQDIYRLPPAHMLTVSPGTSRGPIRYWALDANRTVQYQSDAGYEEHFLELLMEAVRCRMRAPTDPAVMLSGGLDSSAVAGVARQVLRARGGAPLKAYTGVFPSLPEDELTRCDERPYVDALRKQGDLRVQSIRLDVLSPLADIESVVQAVDGPPFICNYYLHRATHDAARRGGVRVILDGSGGDDAVSHGFSLLGELAYHGRWDRLSDEINALAESTGTPSEHLIRTAEKTALHLRARRRPLRFLVRDIPQLKRDYDLAPWSLVKRHLIKTYTPDALLTAWHWLRGYDEERKPPAWRLLNDSFVDRIDFFDRVQTLKAPREIHDVSARWQHWASLHHGAGVTAIGLEDMDGLAAHQGVERRHPFFDVRLLQYCVSLPPKQKLRQGWTRSILRRAVRGIVPDAIRHRTDKADLSLNFMRNTLKHEGERISSVVSSRSSLFNTFVDATALQRAQARGDAAGLWHAVTLHEWLRQVESQVPTSRSHGQTESLESTSLDRAT